MSSRVSGKSRVRSQAASITVTPTASRVRAEIASGKTCRGCDADQVRPAEGWPETSRRHDSPRGMMVSAGDSSMATDCRMAPLATGTGRGRSTAAVDSAGMAGVGSR